MSACRAISLQVAQAVSAFTTVSHRRRHAAVLVDREQAAGCCWHVSRRRDRLLLAGNQRILGIPMGSGDGIRACARSTTASPLIARSLASPWLGSMRP
jgi:hypothetical protein